MQLAGDAPQRTVDVNAGAPAGMEEALQTVAVGRAELDIDAKLEPQLLEDSLDVDRVGASALVAPERPAIAAVYQPPQHALLRKIGEIDRRPLVHLEIGSFQIEIRDQRVERLRKCVVAHQ